MQHVKSGTSGSVRRYAAMQRSFDLGAAAAPDADGTRTKCLLEGIARQIEVAATYNAMAVQFAPHVLYTRADMLYVAGVVTFRRGEPVRQPKMGIFKVDGLSEVTALPETFQIHEDFDPSDPRYAATTIFSVQPAAPILKGTG